MADKMKRVYECQHPKVKALTNDLGLKVEWCSACGAVCRTWATSTTKRWSLPTREQGRRKGR